MTRRSVLAGTGAAAMLSFVPGARAQSGKSDTLRVGLSSYPPNLKPWMNGGTSANTIKLLIFRGLTSFGADGLPQPELAESWSRDGNAGWVFKLRDAVFHNGEKITSADVKWTFEQIAAPNSTAQFRNELQQIVRIETPDDKTVKVTLNEPVVTFPGWLASYHMPIIWRGSAPDAPIGVGPYVLKSQERGVSLNLEAFDRYYRPERPRTKKIQMIAYQDENLRVAAVQAGDVDLIDYVPWQAMDGIQANPNLKLDAVDGPFMLLNFNGSRPPFNDARVRRAVAHAIRRDELVKVAFFGRGSALAHLPIPDSSPFYNPEAKDGWNYDPDRSKRLLAEAGYAGGLSCSLLSTSQYGMHKDTAEVVQQHLAAIGIKAELNLPDWATRVAVGTRGQYDLAVMGTVSENTDPDGIAYLIDGSLSPSFLRSHGLKVDAITELLAAGRAEFDETKRKAIYRELERVAIEQVPIVGLAWRSQGYAMRKSVTGFRNLPGSLTFYSGLTLEDAIIG